MQSLVLHAASFSHCLAAVLLSKLYCPDLTTNIRAQFFAIRLTDVWNRLPPQIVTADTVNASFLKGINSLGAHFLVPDFDYSDRSFFSLFLLWAAISAFRRLAAPPS